jgi:hypothetical protein
MTNEPDEIIDVEVVDREGCSADEPVRNLPAVVETHESAEPVETQPRADGRDWPFGPTPERRCRAHSSRTGEPCKNAAIKGSTVCRFHGGAAKQVKANARARLENAADLMAKKLLGIAIAGESETVKLAAIKDALDRAGLKPPAEVVLSQGNVAPYEEIFDSIATNTREESRAARGYDGYPPSQGDWPNTSQPQSHAATAESYANPATNQASARHPGQGRTYADYGETDADTQRSTATRGYDGAGAQGVARQVHHVTGEAALEVAAQLAETRGLPSPHKRYPRP